VTVFAQFGGRAPPGYVLRGLTRHLSHSSPNVRMRLDASKLKKNMKPLSGIDGAFLSLETPATPMHVGSLHLFETPPRYRREFRDAIKRMISSRLQLAPIFRRRLAQMPLRFANPVWIDEGVDLDYHIRRIDLPPPGNWQQLQECVGKLHAQVLDRSRPLWMLYVFEGLASGDKAYYIKIHHALLDGQAGAALARALFDLSPTPGRAKPLLLQAKGAERPPGALGLAAAAFRHDAAQYVKLVRHLPDVVRALAGMVLGGGKAVMRRRSAKTSIAGELWRNVSFGPRTPINAVITGERGFAAASIPLGEVRAIAAAHEATVNDVVLALCSGALRRYLARHGGIPRKPLIATMPISLRDPGNREFTTQATLSLVSLATHIADPVRRLRAIRAAAGATKSVAQRAKSLIPVDFPTIGGPWIVGALASMYGKTRLANAIPPVANVVISNVAGPAVPLYTAGMRMTGYWPLSIVEHGIGLNITLMSYAGGLGIGFTAASCVVPRPQELVADILAEHKELKRDSLPRPTRRKRAATVVAKAESGSAPRAASGRRKKAPASAVPLAAARKVAAMPAAVRSGRSKAKAARAHA
jgi:WS/DGAT/MGAT family acyltransferase